MTDERASDPRDEVARDAARFLDALKRARESRPGAAIDRLPCYVLIGPAGAGKTSLLLNSGLEFQQAGDREGPPLAGDLAASRQYWFAEDALFVDSAGQGGGATKGETGEASLVRLLRRYRPRRPLNGAIVTLALDALVEMTPDDRRRQIRAIRMRLRELDAALGVRLPVYLVIAKVDRLAGFSAFFDALTPSAREQVWGFTSPLGGSDGEGGNVARFASAFDALAERLDAMLPARLHEEADAEWRVQAFGFPRGFALLAAVFKATLADFVESSNLEAAPRLRGFYFSSAQQSGAPLDPLAEAVSARFGLGLPASNARQGGMASFFLKRLFTDVIIPEQNLVATGLEAENERRLRRALGAGAAVAALALVVFWLLAYSDQLRLLEGAQTRLAAYSDAAKNLPVRDIADADLARAGQTLDESRNVVESSSAYRWAGPFAFDQSGRLLSARGDLYRRALDAIFLPRLLVSLQEAMKIPQRTPREQDSDARAYLMLGGLAPMDENFARSALQSLFERLLPGVEGRAQRQSLNDNAAALLARSPVRLVLDETSVEDAKAQIATGASP
jgi:type VI secretion system protein ImpL